MKRRKGSKVHTAVDTLGNLLTLYVSSAAENDRHHVAELSEAVADATDANVEIMWADQGYTGNHAHSSAAAEGIEMVVVKVPEAKRGLVLLSRRWVVKWSFAWAASFRRLALNLRGLAPSFVGMHIVAYSALML